MRTTNAIWIAIYILLMCLISQSIHAQGYFEKGSGADTTMMPIVSPDGDTIYITNLPTLIVPGHRYRPLTPAQQAEMWRLIRDVRKTLPLAKNLAGQLIETYEYLETLPDSKARNRHIKAVEKELMRVYKPQMKNLTLRQGKLLIKLVNRQCGQSSYQIVKAFFGGWKATWWNIFASFHGASLKVDYDPTNNPEDAITERILQLIQTGRL